MGQQIEFASFNEVADVVEQIQPILEKANKHVGLMALLSLYITIQYPQITEDELIEAVGGASAWVTSYLEGLAMGIMETVPPEKIN